jgi:[glutamine synthetase] adenylyltransferase / [glutamine synthetase]-adenylyl-L-tyrosine phosphorylase
MTVHVRDLLLAPHLLPGRAESLLEPYGFRDPGAADRNLQAIAADPAARRLLARILAELLRCLSDSPDPDGALNHLERFAKTGGSALALLSHLEAQPRAMEILAQVFGTSSFMAEILVRHPAWLYWLSEPEVLERRRTRGDIERDLERALEPLQSEARRLDLLRITRRREILHIGVRDLLRLSSVTETIGALSGLAEALIQKAYETAEGALRREHGLPPLAETGKGRSASSGFAVLGMGKLGGGELNFSSDIDLIYVYGSDRGRMARSSTAPSRPDFNKALALRLTAALADLTDEGYVYRVDLRLRPEGRVGPAAQSVAACEEYYRTRGATWERMALVKAWPVAGDQRVGQGFLKRVRPFVYGRPLESRDMEEIRRIKRDIDRKIAARDESRRNVKLGIGGIREIEFVAQILEIRHGRRDPSLRERNTLAALAALADRGLLPVADHDALKRAYVFLRDVENKLQMVADAQTHSLPRSEDELVFCARRLGYRAKAGGDPADALRLDYETHASGVHRIFEAVLGDQGAFGSA